MVLDWVSDSCVLVGLSLHLPHLALYKPQASECRVFGKDGDTVRTARVVVLTVDEVIPCLTVAVNGAVAEAIPFDVLPTQMPCTSHVLITILVIAWNRQRVLEPIVKISPKLSGH